MASPIKPLNARKQPSQIRDHLSDSDVLNLNYEYDGQSNVIKITDATNSAYSLTNLSYDGLDRLISTTGMALDYYNDLSTNRLTSINDIIGWWDYNFSGGYDSRGNVISQGWRTFDYNLANQMTRSVSNTYVYDGHNRRIETNDSKGVSYSFYSLSGQLLYRETQDGPMSYIHLGSKLIAKDGVAIPAKYSRTHNRPFGSTIEPDMDDIGYTGHKFDTDTALVYMQQRYYDPQAGRFLSNDPVGFTNVHNFNRFTYGNNNPYKYVDPDGRHASQKGFYVHQRATYLAIGQRLEPGENAILANAQVVADGKEFQTTETSFRHAMSGQGQTPAEARTAANSFVRAQFNAAWQAPTREAALHEFGIALHTLQDSTSPAHGGFQQWTGEETFGEQVGHAIQELTNPGEGSELYRVTKDALNWFESGELPEGDLFQYGIDQ